jgi:signal transduction histidine kinase
MSHPADLQKTQAERVDLAQGRRTLRFENRLRTRDGHYRSFSWNAVEEDGLIYCTARDVTDIRAREQALRDSQDFTRLALGAVGGVGVWVYEIAQDLYFYDPAIADLYAVDPAKGTTGLSRTLFLANILPEDLPPVTTALADAADREGEIELEYRVRQPDGSIRWVLSRGYTQAEDGKVTRRTGIGVDITEKRRLEEQLRQSQKMEAVGQLTGGIAHDFNNMLAVVMGSLELLDRRMGDGDARAKHYVQAAADASRRAANLTQRLLVFSRQQPLKPEVVEPNRLVAGMSDLLRHSIGAMVRLETVLAAGTWRTEVDPNQLENVILNLGVNARDAMPDGGRLTVETQNVHLDARYVAAEMGVPPGQYVMIAVSDTGGGMTPDVLAKAFDPFFTTKEPGKGTGLGLSQVYGFVKSSGGHIKIYSEPGEGTTVKIYLPRAEAPEVEIDLDQAGRFLVPGDTHETILVVDDEDAVRHFAVEALSELGYRVLEASTARAALDLLAARPEIVLLLSDVVMPDVNGRKLADQARGLRPDLKVLYMTGYTRNAVVHNGVLDKGVHMIGKPFTLDELAAKVRGLLDAV